MRYRFLHTFLLYSATSIRYALVWRYAFKLLPKYSAAMFALIPLALYNWQILCPIVGYVLYSPFIRIVMCRLHCLHLSHRICLTCTYRPLYPITLEYHTGHCENFFLFLALLFLSIPQLLTISVIVSASKNLQKNRKSYLHIIDRRL